MPKFRFNLEAVLKQRAAAERTKQLAVAGLEQERLAAEEAILAAQREIDAEKNEMRGMLAPGGGAVDLRGVRMQAARSLFAVGEASRAIYRLGGTMKRLDAARGELLRATTARKAVETLRERRYEAWMDEQKRREDAALDEMAVIRGSRTTPDSGAPTSEAA
jgi:flagellar biosynthesis chaperone FliJ